MKIPFKSLALSVLALPLLTATCCAEKDDTYLISNTVGAFDHTHAPLTDVLKKHVRGNTFDYAALKKNPAPLKSYLDSLANVSKADYQKWSKDQQMAFLINLYNAATLELVNDHYPVKSIKKIGGLLGSPWKKEVVRLWGKKVTLDHVEHDLLRPSFNDPRVHFAVNCASIGCPALRAEAFQAAKLDAQLNEQARKFLRDPAKNRVDAKSGTLYLSPIFDWFEKDFVKKSGNVVKFIYPYLTKSDQALLQKGGLKLKYTDYDWDLNKR